MSEESKAAAAALSLAGGVIVTALLDTLIEKGILSHRDVRAVLETAVEDLGPYQTTPEGFEATSIVADLLQRYPEAEL
jgi:hypothetical protein